MCCVSCLVSSLVSYASLALSLAFACLVRCDSCLVSDFVSCASFALSLAFCLVRCVFCLVSCPLGFRSCSSAVDLLVFSLYIISLDKQSYVEIAVNQYKYLVWHCWLSCAFCLCLVFCALCLLRLLPRLSPDLLSGFRSCYDVVDLLGFFSTL